MKNKKYRDNVCAVIRRCSDNSVCIFHRKDFPAGKGWQFPQGGIDVALDLIDELKRELLEEIGTDEIRVVRIAPHRYRYDFPADSPRKYTSYCGQEQTWVLVELIDDSFPFVFTGEHIEFDGYQWVAPVEAIKRIVDFKKNIYIKALKDLEIIPALYSGD